MGEKFLRGLTAERKIGELTKQMEKAQGIRPDGQNYNRSPDGAARANPSEPIMRTDAHISFEDAESITGIDHRQQVSRWAKGLKDPDAYREKPA